MTRVYLDCEFNGLGGDLISMAMVTDRGEEWYQVRWVPEMVHCDPWVWTNVVPFIGQLAVGDKHFIASLEAFLLPLNGCRIIADWPADFEHLSACMTHIGSMNGFRMPIECSMKLIRSGEIKPAVPHNALSDARALRAWHSAQCEGDNVKEVSGQAKKGSSLLWW